MVQKGVSLFFQSGRGSERGKIHQQTMRVVEFRPLVLVVCGVQPTQHPAPYLAYFIPHKAKV